MACFERGDLELRLEPVDVHEVLAAVAEAFALRIEQRGGQLVCELGAPGPVVSGDRVHLAGIFSNLVDNAVKYSPEAPLVRVVTAESGGFLEVKVTDRGQGIAREDQRRVFEKYYRCPTGNRHDVKGYGLGLSFVKRLVRAHGGFVELHSLPGRGTTVTVSLPRPDNGPKGPA
jgi:two-component system phosphate regulon sensor histidine kinase PhoR